MGVIFLPYNTQSTIYFPLVGSGTAAFSTAGSGSLIGTNIQISKDGAALATSTNTGTMAVSQLYSLVLTTSELAAKQVSVLVALGSLGTKVEHQAVLVHTYGDASAMYPFDFGAALADQTIGTVTAVLGGTIGTITGTPVVDVTKVKGTAIAGTQGTLLVNLVANQGTVLVGTIGTLGAQAKADVNAEVVDALGTDTLSELGVGALPATPTIKEILTALYMSLRNQVNVTSSWKTFYNDGGTAIHKKALTDDGITYSEAESTSG